ncbi:MAG: aromatic ring-hydroxylating dioxygenase subunit alpha [Casimicrobiaceae bacterium]
MLPAQQDLLRELIATYRPGFGLPRLFYTTAELYAVEMELFWQRGWLFAGHSSQAQDPGDYFVYEVGTNSAIVVRKEDGTLAAHHNVCRHRGSVIAIEPRGKTRTFVCPYHQWSYGLDGTLRYCRGMQPFDKSQYGLHPVRIEETEGLIYICFAAEPPDFAGARAVMEPILKPQGLRRSKVAKIADYLIPANWKLIWENNRECFHCNVNHPQYIKANFDHYNDDDSNSDVLAHIARQSERHDDKWRAAGLAATHTDAGLTPFPDAERGIWYSANRTILVEGWVTESVDGRRVCDVLMGDYADEDVGTVRARTLPNFWNHSSCDHGVTTRLTPRGPRVTEARMIWLVDEDALEGRDYDLERMLPFWQLTGEQDWQICERQQKGIESSAYTPGPLSQYKEYNLDAFLQWYVNSLRAAL